MTLQELNQKDVIQTKTGENLGRIDDVNFDKDTSQISSVILRGRRHLFGLLGHDDDLEIAWQDIDNIGTDVVMVKASPAVRPARVRRGLFGW